MSTAVPELPPLTPGARRVLDVQLTYVSRTITRIRANGSDVILLPEPPWFD